MIKINSIHLGKYEISVPILSNGVNPIRKPCLPAGRPAIHGGGKY
jgi:hypothetical protein